jgi:hypothetical protein
MSSPLRALTLYLSLFPRTRAVGYILRAPAGLSLFNLSNPDEAEQDDEGAFESYVATARVVPFV